MGTAFLNAVRTGFPRDMLEMDAGDGIENGGTGSSGV